MPPRSLRASRVRRLIEAVAGGARGHYDHAQQGPLLSQARPRSTNSNTGKGSNLARLGKGWCAMAFELPKLPYAYDALAPHISKETLEFHHDKHHAAYVNRLNELIKGTPHENQSLEQIIKGSQGALFNQAGQHFNHSFYWKSLAPKAGGEPKGPVADAIKKSFGDFAAFKKQFSDLAAGHFGSGWAWLIRDKDGSLKVIGTHDAGTPVAQDQHPLLTCDVWEHAYYIDYRNARAKYIEAFWNLVNWDFVAQNLK
jgi:Fe-Mn family superoxide dismutase